ncbi:hypothetical protein AAFF_G00400150 [Aldrovandia affinis]|uniref:Uncharacterized protein n=1 Tax=Aldrovandia affinis TaxID=143900 RepID=A0AAD7VYH0_9TELE|nr:hypothetical protein AAFF_G00400150 [Aldrovandia affinis]
MRKDHHVCIPWRAQRVENVHILEPRTREDFLQLENVHILEPRTREDFLQCLEIHSNMSNKNTDFGQGKDLRIVLHQQQCNEQAQSRNGGQDCADAGRPGAVAGLCLHEEAGPVQMGGALVAHPVQALQLESDWGGDSTVPTDANIMTLCGIHFLSH